MKALFICPYADQVTATAERYYQDRQDLVLLRISRAQLGLDVVDENLLGGAELFPASVCAFAPWCGGSCNCRCVGRAGQIGIAR